MPQLQALFLIGKEINCPLYEEGETFTLFERSLQCPAEKPTCLILVRTMTELLLRFTNPKPLEHNEELYSCGGCSGLIKFSKVENTQAEFGKSTIFSPEEEQILSRVQHFPIFQAMKGKCLNGLAGDLQLKKLSKGDLLIQKGMPNRHLYVVVRGELIVSDGSVVIATLGKGDICGEMSYLGIDTASATVRAGRDGECLTIGGLTFNRLLDQLPTLQRFMTQLLSSRLLQANNARARDFDACMQGRIQDMLPAELLQVFHMNQKTGILSLDLPQGVAKVSFRNGSVINARYLEQSGGEAIRLILREKEGTYRFTIGLSPQEMKAAVIGDFMALLMEGVKWIDEEQDKPEKLHNR